MLSSLNVMVIIGAILTWVIFILGVAQLSRFYARFVASAKATDNKLSTLNSQIKKIQSSMTELILEQRRQIRLQTEQLDLKRAEMTGDYEIVEEPVNSPAAPPPPNERNITLPGAE